MQAQTVLRRKAEAGRQNSGEVAEATPDKAISLAVTKAMRETLALEVTVTQARERRLSLADLPETIEEFSLFMLIEGPGEALGVIAIPPAALSAIIEMQTTGRLGRGNPEPRRPTRTDAAMAADLVDALLMAIDEEMGLTEASVWASGFRYASCLEDPRPLEMLLEDLPYRAWTIELAMGEGGARRGNLLWVIPAQGRGKRGLTPGARESAAARAEDQADRVWTERMELSVNATQAVMDTVLHRFTLPLSTVMTLKPGMTIPVPSDALTRLRLEAGGRMLSLARLGQHSGMRALRLIGAEAEDDEIIPSPRRAAPALKPQTPPTVEKTQPTQTPPEPQEPEAQEHDTYMQRRSAAG
ncbi:FliM/FliN family flagellar motor switch protein [Paenirhodobacter sp.]|uniref:FliM/FliN family flagellar motor switch protein n=1 Tax=Paenirhodobacter sp. TaxID=1965326 RepID=UPI003B40CA47